MATDTVSPNGPSDEGVHYERVDDQTVNMYVEGPGDTTVRPASAAAQAARERDRELIARLIARTRQEQDKLNARKPPSAPMNGVDAM
jgi:hypothetical protein